MAHTHIHNIHTHIHIQSTNYIRFVSTDIHFLLAITNVCFG